MHRRGPRLRHRARPGAFDHAGLRLRRHVDTEYGGADAERRLAQHQSSAGRRKGQSADRAAICGGAGPAGGAMEARPHVRRRRRRAARPDARLQLFQRDRQYPSRRESGHGAGALRRQCLRVARALLSERDSQFQDQAERGAGPRALHRTRRPISAMPMRNTSSAGSISTRRRTIRTRRRAGSSLPPTRASAAPRRRSAISCSRASMCRGKPRAA